MGNCELLDGRTPRWALRHRRSRANGRSADPGQRSSTTTRFEAQATLTTAERVRIERGSDNVFADLGLPDADGYLIRAGLVARIDNIIRQRGLKQVEAAVLLGLSQPDVSRLLPGNFQDFSMERLMRLLTAPGHDVEIVVREPTSDRLGRLTVEA